MHICEHMCTTALGKFSTWKLSPGKFPLGKFHHKKNSHHRKKPHSPGKNPPIRKSPPSKMFSPGEILPASQNISLSSHYNLLSTNLMIFPFFAFIYRDASQIHADDEFLCKIKVCLFEFNLSFCIQMIYYNVHSIYT